MTRSGTHAAWVSAIGLESAFVMFGLIRFFSTRYLGGTLSGIISLGCCCIRPWPARSARFPGRPSAPARRGRHCLTPTPTRSAMA